MSKRAADLVLAFIGLLVLAPLLVLIAALVKLDSRGPVLFRQQRIGKDGRPFRILKFRTMVDHAYTLGPRLTRKRDPRITRVGLVLRWLKLDEIPQLFNVLRGDMSMVGPRPEDPHFVQFYTTEQRDVLSVRPGIVGPSQILGRDELEKYPEDVVDTERYYLEHILPEKLVTDLAYVRSCSFWADLRLVARGVAVTVFGAIKGKFLRFNRRRLLLLGADTVLGIAVYHVAYGLKFEWTYDRAAVPYLVVVSALIAAVRPVLFAYFGLYQNMVRYLGTREFLAIVKATTVGSVAIAALTFMLGLQAHSRLVFLIDWGLLIPVLFGSRVALKTWRESRSRATTEERKHVLIVGADDTGEQLGGVLSSRGIPPYHPVAFLDDDPAKRGVTIHGIRVMGGVADLAVVNALHPIDLVMILYSRISPASLRHAVHYCRDRNLEYRLLPTLDRLLQGDVLLPEVDQEWLLELQGRSHDAGHGNGHAGNGGNGTAAPSLVPASTRPVTSVADRPVVVTGGAGYVGSHLVRKLLAKGRRVRVVDNYLYGDHGLRELVGHPRLEIVEGDVRHLRTLRAAARDADSIIALAALVGDAACELDVEETLSTNLEATRLLAEAAERFHVRRLVFASSCSVYGANSALTLNEGSWLNPVSLYAKTRIQSEAELLSRRDRLGVTILRLATVFGLSKRMRLDLLVNTFTAHGFFEKRINVFGGRQWRPNLHVEDAADAFMLAVTAADDRVSGEIFNVGDNALNYTVLDIARLVQDELPEVKITVTEAESDQRDYRVSFDKIRHVMGFRTRFTVEDGIRLMAQAFRDGEILVPTEYRYHNLRHLKAEGFGSEYRLALRPSPVAH